MKQILFMAFIALLTFNNANAQGYRKNIRVRQGVRSGQITHRERMAIARQQKDVRIAKRVAKSDGIITPRERRIIRREKAQVNNTIYRAKHNNRRRY